MTEISTIVKRIASDGNARGLDEHSFVELVTAQAKRENPELSSAQAFAKAFTASTPDGEMIRKAHAIVKAAPFAEPDHDDSAEAIAELQRIGKQRWPSLSPHQQFSRALETNIPLAKRALKQRPSSTSYPFPK